MHRNGFVRLFVELPVGLETLNQPRATKQLLKIIGADSHHWPSRSCVGIVARISAMDGSLRRCIGSWCSRKSMTTIRRREQQQTWPEPWGPWGIYLYPGRPRRESPQKPEPDYCQYVIPLASSPKSRPVHREQANERPLVCQGR